MERSTSVRFYSVRRNHGYSFFGGAFQGRAVDVLGAFKVNMLADPDRASVFQIAMLRETFYPANLDSMWIAMEYRRASGARVRSSVRAWVFPDWHYYCESRGVKYRITRCFHYFTLYSVYTSPTIVPLRRECAIFVAYLDSV